MALTGGMGDNRPRGTHAISSRPVQTNPGLDEASIGRKTEPVTMMEIVDSEGIRLVQRVAKNSPGSRRPFVTSAYPEDTEEINGLEAALIDEED